MVEEDDEGKSIVRRVDTSLSPDVLATGAARRVHTSGYGSAAEGVR